MWGCNFGGWFGNNGWFHGGGMFGLLWMILLIVGVVWLVSWLVRTALPGGRAARTADPLATLKETYAKGEMSEQEYLHRKEVLLR